MIALAFSFLLAHQLGGGSALDPETIIKRTNYGVPVVRARTEQEAYFAFGYAVAQDRLWQMDLSRRAARGTLSALIGKQAVTADQQTFSQMYTESQLYDMVVALPKPVLDAFEMYAQGVNRYIAKAKSNGTLPPEYQGQEPEVWRITDSAAIVVQLMRRFGNGGSGEIRNLALLEWLKTQPKLKGKALDAFDDFAWQNDPKAQTTVSPQDDPVKDPPKFPNPTRTITNLQLDGLPKLGLFELLPAVNSVELTDSLKLNQQLSIPYKTGSYAVVVSPTRSATKTPILLSGPQMGFTQPSIVHEASLHAPGFDVAGMDVPGIPAILVGATPNLAWGVTTGVADVEDIVVVKKVSNTLYEVDGQKLPIEMVTQTLPVKGDPNGITLKARFTKYGPIVFENKAGTHYYVKRRAYAGQEVSTLVSTFDLYRAKTVPEVEAGLRKAAMNFNFFTALKSGEIGWRYTGYVPQRALNIDPRFPTILSKSTDWQGMIPFEKMPHVWNPKGGLIVNWNNKPVRWWSNLDTPAWGEAFRNKILLEELTKPQLTVADVEKSVWAIARKSEDYSYFAPFIPKGSSLDGFDGWMLDGSQQATLAEAFVPALRSAIFLPTTGNFASPNYFNQVAQPSVMLKALRGQTKVNYLDGRSSQSIILEALKAAEKATEGKPGYAPWSIQIPGQPAVSYRNRGTYIQVIELGSTIRGKNVLPPGVATTGPNSQDQAALSRGWTYKPMVIYP